MAIQKPADRENAVQVIVDISGHGINTSGNYRNYYELDGKHFSCVIDPQTGCSIEHNLVPVTVISSAVLETDDWGTGLMALGPEKAKEAVHRKGLAVYTIVKEGEGSKTRMSSQFSSFLVNEKNQKTRLWVFIPDDGDALRLSATFDKEVRNGKSFTHH